MNRIIAGCLILLFAASITGLAHAQLSSVPLGNDTCAGEISGLLYPEFSGKVVVVTGGSSGIGLATVRLLSASGAIVVIFDKVPPSVPDGAPSRMVKFRATDISNSDALADSIAAVLGDFPRIDGVVANAGVHASGTILDTTEQEFDAVMNVNLKGTFFTVNKISRLLEKQAARPYWGRGNIVVVGSDQSLIGKAKSLAYGTSKAALAGLVRSSAVALLPYEIRINLVCPGTINTPFLDQAILNHSSRYNIESRGMKETYEVGVPGQKFVTVDEVASSILFLLSPRSSGTTATLLSVDKGSTAQ